MLIWSSYIFFHLWRTHSWYSQHIVSKDLEYTIKYVWFPIVIVRLNICSCKTNWAYTLIHSYLILTPNIKYWNKNLFVMYSSYSIILLLTTTVINNMQYCCSMGSANRKVFAHTETNDCHMDGIYLTYKKGLNILYNTL